MFNILKVTSIYILILIFKFQKKNKNEKKRNKSIHFNNLKIKPPMIYSELLEACGTSCPSLRTIYNWVDRFNNQVKSFQDCSRVGRPILATRTTDVGRVEALIIEDSRIS